MSCFTLFLFRDRMCSSMIDGIKHRRFRNFNHFFIYAESMEKGNERNTTEKKNSHIIDFHLGKKKPGGGE